MRRDLKDALANQLSPSDKDLNTSFKVSSQYDKNVVENLERQLELMKKAWLKHFNLFAFKKYKLSRDHFKIGKRKCNANVAKFTVNYCTTRTRIKSN